MRGGTEKYAKFAYSSRYGFSIEADQCGFVSGAFDSALAFSDDGVHYRVRETNAEAKLAGDILYSRWSPWPDVTVETWLVPSAPWHVRVHRIRTPRALQTAEGGFAMARRDFDRDILSKGRGPPMRSEPRISRASSISARPSRAPAFARRHCRTPTSSSPRRSCRSCGRRCRQARRSSPVPCSAFATLRRRQAFGVLRRPPGRRAISRPASAPRAKWRALSGRRGRCLEAGRPSPSPCSRAGPGASSRTQP